MCWEGRCAVATRLDDQIEMCAVFILCKHQLSIHKLSHCSSSLSVRPLSSLVHSVAVSLLLFAIFLQTCFEMWVSILPFQARLVQSFQALSYRARSQALVRAETPSSMSGPGSPGVFSRPRGELAGNQAGFLSFGTVAEVHQKFVEPDMFLQNVLCSVNQHFPAKACWAG